MVHRFRGWQRIGVYVWFFLVHVAWYLYTGIRPVYYAQGRVHRLRGLVADEGDNHAVEVEEEHDQVEAELHE